MSELLICITCGGEKIEAYIDGSNIKELVDFFFKHKEHNIQRTEYP